MPSLRTITRANAAALREAKDWIAIYKTGLSWHSVKISISIYKEPIEPDDLLLLTEILNLDPRAIIVNGYYSGNFKEDMSLADIAYEIERIYRYGSKYDVLSVFIETHRKKENALTA